MLERNVVQEEKCALKLVLKPGKPENWPDRWVREERERKVRAAEEGLKKVLRETAARVCFRHRGKRSACLFVCVCVGKVKARKKTD